MKFLFRTKIRLYFPLCCQNSRPPGRKSNLQHSVLHRVKHLSGIVSLLVGEHTAAKLHAVCNACQPRFPALLFRRSSPPTHGHRQSNPVQPEGVLQNLCERQGGVCESWSYTGEILSAPDPPGPRGRFSCSPDPSSRTRPPHLHNTK